MENDAFKKIKLSELANITAGYPLRGSADRLPEGDCSYVQLKNTNRVTGIEWGEVLRVSLPSNRMPKWLSNNDVLFASRGTRTLAYSLSNTPDKAVCAPHFFVLGAIDQSVVSHHFLAWQINQKPAQSYLTKNSSGAAMRNISRSILENLIIALPPLETQLKIVSFWQAAIREEQLLKTLIENRKNQFKSLAAGLFEKGAEA